MVRFSHVAQPTRELPTSRAEAVSLQTTARHVTHVTHATGLFEDPNAGVVSDEQALNALLDAPAHRRVALEAAEQGIVLLQNREHALPLTSRSYDVSKGVALIGESASCEFSQSIDEV